MSRTLTFLFAAFAAVASPLAAAEKPNLIFILADDLGYGDVGCFGQEKIKTPRIDAMARKGMRLTDFYAGAPVCAPSRSVLMTGPGISWSHLGARQCRQQGHVRPDA